MRLQKRSDTSNSFVNFSGEVYTLQRYFAFQIELRLVVGSLKMNTTLEYSTRVSRRETVDVKRVL